jgi:hypothetical protein
MVHAVPCFGSRAGGVGPEVLKGRTERGVHILSVYSGFRTFLELNGILGSSGESGSHIQAPSSLLRFWSETKMKSSWHNPLREEYVAQIPDSIRSTYRLGLETCLAHKEDVMGFWHETEQRHGMEVSTFSTRDQGAENST